LEFGIWILEFNERFVFMKVIGIIPARWASTRFPGKVLAVLAGKPMIQHVWERCKESKKLTDIIIACDEEKVKAAARSFGAKVVMTSKDHPSGTDRIAEAVKDIDADIIINIQGDEPLIQPSVIDSLADALLNGNAPMATVIKVLSDKKDLDNPNVVKVTINEKSEALSFSRLPIKTNNGTYYKHLGIYAYRKDFLMTYKDLPESALEKRERLEQLRALQAGYVIKTVLTDIETIGVDTPEDLARVEKLM